MPSPPPSPSPSSSSSSPSPTPLTIGEEFIPSPTHLPPSTLTLDFDGLLHPALQLQQDAKEGCGGQAWPAGIVLTKYLLRTKRSELAGKTILELGAGGGLVGLALALALRLPTLHITDQPPLLALMRQNISLNNLTQSVHASILDWGTPFPCGSLPTRPDVLLAADCVYFEPAFGPLLETMRQAMGPETVCFFCFKKRRRADWGFVRRARKMFVVRDVRDDPDRGAWEREGMFLYEIRKRVA